MNPTATLPASETRQVVTEWFEALGRGDVETALQCMADDVRWENIEKVDGVSDIIPWLGGFRGRGGVAEAFRLRDGVVEVEEFAMTDLVVQDNKAVAVVHERTRVNATGNRFDIDFVSWYEVRDGKIVRFRAFTDSAPIVAAMRQ
jgi:ketosteroid isomerase-like protein